MRTIQKVHCGFIDVVNDLKTQGVIVCAYYQHSSFDDLLPLWASPLPTLLETDIQEQDKKKAKNKQSRARNGKDKVKPKPKSVKVRKSTPTKSKVIQLKKIQLEGLKLPNLKLYYGTDNQEKDEKIRALNSYGHSGASRAKYQGSSSF
ncbi:hypothetical protein Tco_1268606 [Tanacetum coccineum]